MGAVRKVLAFPTRAVYSMMEDRYYLLLARGEAIAQGDRWFPDDPRLDQAVTLPPMEFQPLIEALQHLEVGNRVPLETSLALSFAYELVLDAPIRQTLREFMASVAVPGTKWVKDGNGYKLVPAPEEGKKH